MKIFCSGIGGIGLSAYAALMHAQGHTVVGSDRTESELLDDLRAQGIAVSTKQDGSAIPKGCDLFVYTEALAGDHPERKVAAARGIRSISYFTALGELSAPYNVIAVSGTHGKSSTTGMLSKILVDVGTDPTVIVGTKLPDLGGRNWRSGKSKIFLLEACEYRRSFHALSPALIVITNVDGDHFDYYASLDDYHRAFTEFIEQLPPSGFVVMHGEDSDTLRIAEASARNVLDADQYALPELSVPGVHMRQNAQLALAAAVHLGIPREIALQSLKEYHGAWRRMELVGMFNGIPVIDDYGHHPREVAATLQAVGEKYPKHRIVCIFQPHTHDRTLKLYDDFTKAFSGADLVIIPGIYEARRERDAATTDVEKFVKDIAKRSGVECTNGRSLE
ncbi:MAG: UDP-N-acetylmuramate--L-alanine ligase, partial [Candidatus Peregrinibacteria bacterium Greene0416_62]